MTDKKYMLAGSILAGVGVAYAIGKNLDVEKVADRMESNFEKFKDIVEELVSFSVEVLEKILLAVRKLIMEGVFKVKVMLGIA